MSTNKDRNARVTRWFLELQNYKFRVEHRPGKDIQHADAMSRLYEEEGLEAPTPGGELRGGVCGVSLARRPGEYFHQVSRGSEGGVQHQGQAQPLGRLIEGRYVPNHVLNQLDMMTPAIQVTGWRQLH